MQDDESLRYKCKFCPFKSNRLRTVSQHEHSIHDFVPPDEKIQCPKCPVMISRERMGRHERLHHDEKLPFSCQKCQFRALTQHNIDVHSGTHHFDDPNQSPKILPRQNAQIADCSSRVNCCWIITWRHTMRTHLDWNSSSVGNVMQSLVQQRTWGNTCRRSMNPTWSQFIQAFLLNSPNPFRLIMDHAENVWNLRSQTICANQYTTSVQNVEWQLRVTPC